jgi:rare lipoprotein A
MFSIVRFISLGAVGAGMVFLWGCRTMEAIVQEKKDGPPKIYVRDVAFSEYGTASWYGGRWIGRLTANGETYAQGDMTAAHNKLPFGTQVRVVDLKTGNDVLVRINNRGPFVKGRIIDLSVRAAHELGTYERGIAKVRVDVLKEVPILTKPNRKLKEPAVSAAGVKKED